MKHIKNTFLLLLLFISNSVLAQTPVLTVNDSITKSYWMVSAGYNFVDDSGAIFDDLVAIKSSWNAVAYPSQLSIGKFFSNGLGVEALASYLKYNKGKLVDGQILDNELDFFSFDMRLNYDLNKLIGETGWFDPYIGIGPGYSNIDGMSRYTGNATIGFRAWITEKIGINLNASGKWSTKSVATNYKQYTAGISYRFNIKKQLTEDGESKLALIEKLEQDRINDSIAFANQQEKERQKQLAVEEEKARLAKIKKEEEEAKAKELAEIKDAISSLEKISFGFSSAILKSESRPTILKLAKILEAHPDLVIEISAHTDSRGAREFNQKLSEKRLKSTIDYLLSFDVKAENVVGKAYGEDKLLNECDDHVKCSEDKHKLNRRSEFKVLER